MCHRYFVMTSARQTMYCGGWATELWRGKKITCRNLAAQQKRKELAAKALAKEHKQLAASDPVYAAKLYIADSLLINLIAKRVL